MQSSWQTAWVIMAAIVFVVTAWSWWVIPDRPLYHQSERLKLVINTKLFIRPRCFPLYIAAFVYGLLLSVFLTFAIDLILSTGGISTPADKLFWVLLGVAGLPTIFAGELITRFGARTLLLVSIPLCGFSYAIIALLPQSLPAIFISATLFGMMSILPGNGLLIWGMRLFHPRPSLGTGAVFFLLSLAVIVGPAACGYLVSFVPMYALFLVTGALSIVVLPLIPSDIENLKSNLI